MLTHDYITVQIGAKKLSAVRKHFQNRDRVYLTYKGKGKGFVTRSIPQRGISLPVRASLSSKEEPCPLRPHRGFLIPCPLPLINIIHHLYHGFGNASLQ